MLWEFYDRLSCLPISWDYFIWSDLCGYGWNVYWFNNILHAISIHPCHTEKLSIIKRFRRIAFCYLIILSKTYIMYTSHISVFANTKMHSMPSKSYLRSLKVNQCLQYLSMLIDYGTREINYQNWHPFGKLQIMQKQK